MLQMPVEQTSGYSGGIALSLRVWDWARSASSRAMFYPGAAKCFFVSIFFM